MKDISTIDKNFKIETKIDKPDIKFYDADVEPFKVYGVFRENGMYRRIPEAVAKTVNEGVLRLHANTAGGRVRFKTDSAYIALKVVWGCITRMNHFAFSGSAGFDLYVGNNHVKTFFPPAEGCVAEGVVVDFGEKEMPFWK